MKQLHPPPSGEQTGKSSGRNVSPSDRPDHLDRSNLEVGKPLANATGIEIFDEDGNTIPLLDILASEKDTVIVRGCLTCPVFLRVYPEVETMAKDFPNVSFYYLYGSLAHPENNGFIQPFTIEERLMHVQEAKDMLGTSVTWYCDNIENEAKTTLGNAPNSGYLFDNKGNLVIAQGWFDPEAMRTTLEGRHTPPTERTTIESLQLPEFEAISSPASGVVPRVTVNERMMNISTEPSESTEPYYVKLRTEASQDLLSSGKGKLYIGFHLDPIHDVHWNNLVTPIEYEFTLPEDCTITPQTGKGPTVSQATDVDPREFLLDVENWSKGDSITCAVKYYACSDSEGWCKPVQQEYEITLEANRQGGSAMTRSPRSRGRQGGEGSSGSRGGQSPTLDRFDSNKDGVLTPDEVPERMSRMFDRMDSNNDGKIDAEEFNKMVESRKNRPQGGRGGGRGSGSGGR